jgi:alpha-tubulin suppressor-like RCC1 family protein
MEINMKTTFQFFVLLFLTFIIVSCDEETKSADPVCGDGIINGTDECDGDEFGVVSCTSQGYYGGTIACTDECVIDNTECVSAGRCGNDTIESGLEECDGTNYNNVECIDYGYYGGEMSCTNECILGTENCGKFIEISVGGAHTCALTKLGDLYCWGSNLRGQVGIGNIVIETIQEPTLILSNVNNFVSGVEFTCASKVDGTLWCWGANGAGQLGIGDYTDSSTPVQVGTDTDWGIISASDRHTCATKTQNSELWCWGANQFYETGTDSATSINMPNQVFEALNTEVTNVISIGTGPAQTCFVKNDGSTLCLGAKPGLPLGLLCELTERMYPEVVQSEGIDLIADQVDCGWTYCCAVSDDATRNLYCWGMNLKNEVNMGGGLIVNFKDGMVGDYLPVCIQDATKIRMGTSLVDVENVDKFSTMSLTNCFTIDSTTDELYCWGYDSNGQVGNGIVTGDTFRPELINYTGNSIESISAGVFHSCMIVDGNYNCWGYGLFYQLGNNDNSTKQSP